jgi:hypothetical protein
MTHLTDEQFEDIIQGTIPEPEHVSGCEQCRNALASKRATAERLRAAFASVKPSENLAANIRAELTKSSKAPEKVWHAGHPSIIRLTKAVWPAAAAAVLIIAVILGIYGISPQPVLGAPAELVQIHQHNLSDSHEFYSESDPKKLAEYFKEKLGFSPSMPALGRGMEIRGCCVRHFQGKIVGSYVVDTPEAVISIIAVTAEPQTLDMNSSFEYEGHTFYKATFAKCDMVATRLGNYTYCAVGEVSHDYLTQLLASLIPKDN